MAERRLTRSLSTWRAMGGEYTDTSHVRFSVSLDDDEIERRRLMTAQQRAQYWHTEQQFCDEHLRWRHRYCPRARVARAVAAAQVWQRAPSPGADRPRWVLGSGAAR